MAGDLGAALADKQDAAKAVKAAQVKGEEIVEAARREAAKVIEAAEREAATAGQTYATAWSAAKDAGWTPAQLRSMGYDKPPTARKATTPKGTTPAALSGQAAAADVA